MPFSEAQPSQPFKCPLAASDVQVSEIDPSGNADTLIICPLAQKCMSSQTGEFEGKVSLKNPTTQITRPQLAESSAVSISAACQDKAARQSALADAVGQFLTSLGQPLQEPQGRYRFFGSPTDTPQET